ncbi:hypothetical protein [Paenibacillus sp. P36]|uniref:hypothetical protein n=1 Tax=Paenibacillus sp. P36 TaxID=3342538 RepID=UPI0038B381F6
MTYQQNNKKVAIIGLNEEIGLGTISRSIAILDVEDNPFLPQFQHPCSLIIYCAMISFGFPIGKVGAIAFGGSLGNKVQELVAVLVHLKLPTYQRI